MFQQQFQEILNCVQTYLTEAEKISLEAVVKKRVSENNSAELIITRQLVNLISSKYAEYVSGVNKSCLYNRVQNPSINQLVGIFEQIRQTLLSKIHANAECLEEDEKLLLEQELTLNDAYELYQRILQKKASIIKASYANELTSQELFWLDQALSNSVIDYVCKNLDERIKLEIDYYQEFLIDAEKVKAKEPRLLRDSYQVLKQLRNRINQTLREVCAQHHLVLEIEMTVTEQPQASFINAVRKALLEGIQKYRDLLGNEAIGILINEKSTSISKLSDLLEKLQFIKANQIMVAKQVESEALAAEKAAIKVFFENLASKIKLNYLDYLTSEEQASLEGVLDEELMRQLVQKIWVNYLTDSFEHNPVSFRYLVIPNLLAMKGAAKVNNQQFINRCPVEILSNESLLENTTGTTGAVVMVDWTKTAQLLLPSDILNGHPLVIEEPKVAATYIVSLNGESFSNNSFEERPLALTLNKQALAPNYELNAADKDYIVKWVITSLMDSFMSDLSLIEQIARYHELCQKYRSYILHRYDTLNKTNRYSADAFLDEAIAHIKTKENIIEPRL